VRLDRAAGADGDLPAVVLALAHHVGDLGVAVVEHLAEQEDRPLDRREALEEDGGTPSRASLRPRRAGGVRFVSVTSGSGNHVPT
jgi:hypothetical protein